MVASLKSLTNQKGNALLISLGVVIAVSITFLALTGSFRSAQNQQKKIETIQILEVLQESLVGTIENDASFKQTVTSAGLSCLATDGQVCPAVTQNLNVYLADGTLFASGNPADNRGFDAFGTPCVGFNQAVPNNACPFKFQITWTPVCPGGPCPSTLISPLTGTPVRPPVQIDIQLLYSGTNPAIQSININRRMTKQFQRGSLSGTLAAACRNALGDFDPATQKCLFQAKACPQGYVINGFDAAGQPTCTMNYFLDRSCGSGFAVTDIIPGGRLRCWKF